MAEMKCRYCGSEVTDGELRGGSYCPQSPNNKHQLT